MKVHLFRMTCLTNLHVGSGDASYGIIDNELERDSVLKNVPVIHASGVKGALKEYCKSLPSQDKLTDDQIKYIFGYGDPDNPDTSTRKTEQGNYKFFTANLLTRPLRVTEGTKSYVPATTPEIIDAFKTLADGLGYTGLNALMCPSVASDQEVLSTRNGISVEGLAVTESPALQKATDLKSFIGDDELVLVASMENFPFPVLARNQLENGISQNLWYEEVVPHTSRFYFFIITPDEKPEIYNLFREAITKTNRPVQFGGNASIGYGYCKLEEVVPSE